MKYTSSGDTLFKVRVLFRTRKGPKDSKYCICVTAMLEEVPLLIRLGDGEFDGKSSKVCACAFFRFVHRTDFVPLRKVFEVTPLKSEPAQDGVKIVIIYSSSANVASIPILVRELHSHTYFLAK